MSVTEWCLNIKAFAEQLIPICYKAVTLEGGYRLDLQVADQIVVSEPKNP